MRTVNRQFSSACLDTMTCYEAMKNKTIYKKGIIGYNSKGYVEITRIFVRIPLRIIVASAR